VLGPFQGPVACTRIGLAKGVCGRAYTSGQTVIVPNVDEFEGHIACSSAARSEIVVPLKRPNGEVVGVLDVDSDRFDDFSSIDAEGLGGVARLVERIV